MNASGGTAFVFPGQGSQSVGMLKALAADHSQILGTFREASEALGYDLWELTQNGPEEALNRTAVTQPALLAADVGCYRAWRARDGIEPVVMAGHSLGEYAALVCAEALDFRQAVRLVARRGALMQAAVPQGEGAMAAILGLDDAAVEAVCRDCAHGETLAAANYNAPGQVVIAGTKAAVDRALVAARSAGARRSVVLAVSAPSHCGLMREAAQQFAQDLAGVALNAPAVPVIHNATVAALSEPGPIREALVSQLFSPVRWVETIRRMAEWDVSRILECGPGKVLTGLNKRIVDLPCASLGEPADFGAALGVTGP
ncbi:ACP S-malonyltransferase [Acidiferrobacter sp.]|jgi:[acyl-carrier-protein] S-malonyltransferase|uniref:ACP S-malonyltransferase n=1 Tax=Acidiferrobacter sp. TaxID=1872107 RepID=UPI00263852EA|nr:ACP S-malonyltransferase [Acidiferrobacter sp.]